MFGQSLYSKVKRLTAHRDATAIHAVCYLPSSGFCVHIFKSERCYVYILKSSLCIYRIVFRISEEKWLLEESNFRSECLYTPYL